MIPNPDFIEKIAEDRLRDAARAVWARLSLHVQTYLEALGPMVVVVADDEFKKFPGSDPDDLGRTVADLEGRPGILLRKSLTNEAKAVRRYIIAHELAHVALQHYHWAHIGPLMRPSDEERKLIHLLHEEHAEWVIVKWGFEKELEAMEAAFVRKIGYKPKPGQWVGKSKWRAGQKFMEEKHGLGRLAAENN